ncbi:thiamine phosphate synthase [Vitreoscilla sp. C1]|uniref:thiamine phosphate synthase n=1 Tax=Vitreoscilla sp. (strain C1) TaxID=96942 RepID=UPI001EFF9148|nr:thiamine phosphate synthase [Vitreoscilla sp. C1]
MRLNVFGRENLKLYFIMGSQDVDGRPEQALQVLKNALIDGITLFQWREKGVGSLQNQPEAYEQFACACLALCREHAVPFIVNDDVALALKLHADGVHIGQDDANVAATRALIGNKILGVSAHSVEEVASAMAMGADYVGLGPIYPTVSKMDANAPTGLVWLKQARAAFPDVAMVAIGGINLERAPEVFAAGADGIAVISAICRHRDFVRDFYQLGV